MNRCAPGHSIPFACIVLGLCCASIPLHGIHGVGELAHRAEPLTPQHGTLLWIYRRNRAYFSAPGLDPVTGRVYVGDSRGRVFALRGEDGFTEWITEPRPLQPVLSAPVAGPDATVYTTTGGGRVLALDSRDGRLKWVFRTAWGIADSPVVGPNHLLYFQNDADQFYAVDARTGRQRWTYAGGRNGATPGAVDSPAMVGARIVVFASRNGSIYGLDAETGRRQWVFEPVSLPSKRRRMDDERLALGGIAVSDGGTVYVGASDGRVHALDGYTGRQIRAYDGSSESGCTPALGTHGTLYFEGSNGCLQCVDRQSGKRIWQSRNSIGSAPVVGIDGRVYCAGAGPDDLRAYDGLNGRGKWEYQQLDAHGYDHIAPRGEVDYLLYSSFSSPVISGQTVYVGEVDDQDPYGPGVPHSGEGRAVLAVRAPAPGGPDLAAPAGNATPTGP